MYSIIGLPDAKHLDAIYTLIRKPNEGKVINPAVYITTKALHKPKGKKSDFHLTDEHWSLEDIAVKRAGYIDVRKLMYGGSYKNKRWPISKNVASDISQDEYLLVKSLQIASWKKILDV